MIKQALISIILVFCSVQTAFGQEYKTDKNGLALDTIIHFTKADLDPLFGLLLKSSPGWIFKSGNDNDWSSLAIDLTGWERLSPSQITNDMADSAGKFEGWFRLQFTIDSAIAKLPLYLDKEDHAAEDIYLNGKLFRKFGEIGKDRASFKEHIQHFEIRTPIFLEPDTVHTLVIHYVNYSNIDGIAKTLPLGSTRIVTNDYFDYMGFLGYKDLFNFLGSFIFFILFWLLYFLIRKERELLILALFCTVMLFFNLSVVFNGGDSLLYTLPSNYMVFINFFRAFLGYYYFPLCFLFAYRIFYGKLPKWFILVSLIIPFISYYFVFFLLTIGIGIFLLYLSIKSAKKATSVRVLMYSLTISHILTVTGQLVRSSYVADDFSLRLIMVNSDVIAKAILYLGMLAYVAYRMREKNLEMQQNATELVKVEAEKSALIASQNEVLELKVTERTAALNQSLEELKATQSQLIQSEKMASLGELTAGIAHEIQNPLNFVNNFAEVSNELIDEMNEELDNGELEEAKAISKDIKQNLNKISHHGNRADGIVKGMLQHSRASGDKKEPTDINALADEYLRLAYHGIRAKDKSFNAQLVTDFDDKVKKLPVIPQDLGRVILNLLTNAFYVVNERKKSGDKNYKPTVSISTKKMKDHIEIKVSDNGKGMSNEVKEKVFQPFFTTKPTGQGTGLGLSMSYDIITKGHGGSLNVETKKGEGSIFIIKLPISMTNNQ